MTSLLRRWLPRVLVCGVVLTVLTGADAPEDDKFKISDDEQIILDATNAVRKKEKLPALKANPVLFKVARAHSANMAKQGELNHVLDEKNPAQRVKAAGYEYRSVGENIAYGDFLKPEKAMDLWMDSPHHKENILRDTYQEIGIGIARNDKGEIYYTQVFGTQRKRR